MSARKLAGPVGTPAARPCGSCPYREDAPSGLWERDEYEKLPPYDRPTGEQPPKAFFCHQQDGRLCAGWVGCHDMNESLGLRIAAASGAISAQAYETALDYKTDVPLFASGEEAAEHGLREVDSPTLRTKKTIERLARKLTKEEPQ